MPLLWAAYQGHLDVAQVLVEAGAALSATDKARWWALACCAQPGSAGGAAGAAARAARGSEAWVRARGATANC
jgi:hypothetical protein